MKISVVVCSYNRCESLERALISFQKIYVPEAISWELIIVDNNSQDKTKDIYDKFKYDGELNLHYVFEGQQGLSYARNRGVKHAQGEIIAFTDDDVVIDQYWLFNIYRAFTEHQASCIGGKILPLWAIAKPEWLVEDLYHVLALLDYGDKPFYMESPCIWGANFAVQADMFPKYGLFNVNLGRIPGKLTSGEEVDFLERLLNGGEKILYYPNAVIYHCIPKERISKNYFRRWYFYNAASNIFRSRNPKSNYSWSRSYSKVLKIILDIIFYFISIFSFSRGSFKYQLKLIYNFSYIYHKLKYKH